MKKSTTHQLLKIVLTIVIPVTMTQTTRIKSSCFSNEAKCVNTNVIVAMTNVISCT